MYLNFLICSESYLIPGNFWGSDWGVVQLYGGLGVAVFWLLNHFCYIFRNWDSFNDISWAPSALQTFRALYFSWSVNFFPTYFTTIVKFLSHFMYTFYCSLLNFFPKFQFWLIFPPKKQGICKNILGKGKVDTKAQG